MKSSLSHLNTSGNSYFLSFWQQVGASPAARVRWAATAHRPSRPAAPAPGPARETPQTGPGPVAHTLPFREEEGIGHHHPLAFEQLQRAAARWPGPGVSPGAASQVISATPSLAEMGYGQSAAQPGRGGFARSARRGRAPDRQSATPCNRPAGSERGSTGCKRIKRPGHRPAPPLCAAHPTACWPMPAPRPRASAAVVHTGVACAVGGPRRPPWACATPPTITMPTPASTAALSTKRHCKS